MPDSGTPRQLITLGVVFGALGLLTFALFHDDLGAGRRMPVWVSASLLVGVGVVGVVNGLVRRHRSRRQD